MRWFNLFLLPPGPREGADVYLADNGAGGKHLVGQQVAESMPGLVAVVASFGAEHVFSWKGVEQMLKSAGYELSKRYLRYMPYYIAVWEPRR